MRMRYSQAHSFARKPHAAAMQQSREIVACIAIAPWCPREPCNIVLVMGSDAILAGPSLRQGDSAALSGDVRMGGATLRLVLLGQMEAWGLASTSVLPKARKARALLGILGLADGAPVPRQRLCTLLWSRSAEPQRRGSLRQALHELQTTLGDAAVSLLHTDRDAVQLQRDGVWVDALEVVRASPQRPAPLDLMREGVDLMADLEGIDPAFDRWLGEQRRRLRRQATEAAGALLTLPGPPALLATAARLTALDPSDDEAWRRRPQGDPAPPTEFSPRPAAFPRRGVRLGVLPLRALGEGVAPHLLYGLAESIATALARFRWLFVADCASLAAVGQASQAPEAPEIAARAMGLDLLLGGTLQAGAEPGRLRLGFRLTDLRQDAGAIVWAERFDRETADLLALQDEVAAAIVGRMDPEILLIEAGRAASATTRGATVGTAYDLLLRALSGMQGLERGAFFEAGRLLEEAGRLEPGYAAILSWHAWWHLFLVGQGWPEDEESAMAEAERLAARAVALDPLDAQGLSILGHVRAFMRHRIDEALVLHRRALSLNPNLAMAWVFLGMAESYAGAHGAALTCLDRYAELAPCHPHAFFFDAARGIPLLFLRRHEAAAEVGRTVTALNPGLSYPYKTYLAALGHLDLRDEAAVIRTRLLAIEPDFTVEKALRRTPVRRPADRAHYARGLRKAGLA